MIQNRALPQDTVSISHDSDSRNYCLQNHWSFAGLMWLYFGQDLSSECFAQTPHVLNCQCSRYQLPALQIPAQPCPVHSSRCVPISAFPARRPKKFLAVSLKQVRAHSAHTSMASVPSRMSVWHSEPGITEMPVKQFTHSGWCIDKKAVLCFKPEVDCLSLSAKHHFGNSTTPKWGNGGRGRKRTCTVLFLGNSFIEAKTSPDPT